MEEIGVIDDCKESVYITFSQGFPMSPISIWMLMKSIDSYLLEGYIYEKKMIWKKRKILKK